VLILDSSFVGSSQLDKRFPLIITGLLLQLQSVVEGSGKELAVINSCKLLATINTCTNIFSIAQIAIAKLIVHQKFCTFIHELVLISFPYGCVGLHHQATESTAKARASEQENDRMRSEVTPVH